MTKTLFNLLIKEESFSKKILKQVQDDSAVLKDAETSLPAGKGRFSMTAPGVQDDRMVLGDDRC